MGKNSNFFLKLGLFFGTLFVCVFVLEVSLRLYQFVRHGIPLLYDEAPVWHEFGWEGKEIRGDVDTQKLKILLVGDSYTEGCNLDPAKMYYAYLKKVLDAEIFVYAGIGYGTAQEYLVLQRYVKQIEPDLVILQVSSNDFWDNVRQLDIAILVIRKYMRPYYIAQRMEYHTPHSFQLMQGPLGNLRVARVVYYQLQRLRID
ncbi:MAG: SGNH/GDSL hydrolase family protein, partial [Candidatus Omnitrophica bacterium]|nr:SGNH/GDSL hydrolase family protein [Candidatus Omnitrophota bacterium]